jgi:hypothetical protein
MSAIYFGNFPVKKIVATSVVGQGVLIKTQKIIAPISTASSYVPAINSVFTEDSSLWVTDAKIDYQDNGLAEITIVASGLSPNVSTTVEIQPNAPFIFGFESAVNFENDFYKIRAMIKPTVGSCVVVKFVAAAGEEANIITTYSGNPMPFKINDVSLPPHQYPITLFHPDAQSFNLGNEGSTRLTYKGYICKDTAMVRQGSAVNVSLFYKESVKVEYWERASSTTSILKTSLEY